MKPVVGLCGLGVLIAANFGCVAPTFGPPGRLVSGGMPEAVGVGALKASVHGSAGGAWTLGGKTGVSGEIRAATGVAHWLDLDIGAGLAIAKIGGSKLGSPAEINETWMGSATLRAYPLKGPVSVALGAGFGVGCGGAYESVSLCQLGRAAFVPIGEFDVGYRGSERWAVYLVNRFQPSYVKGMESTFWSTHSIGVEVNFPQAKGLFLTPELGTAVLATDDIQWLLTGLSFGVGFKFGGG
ncbi:MAG: hypothetical protein IPK82_12320 [Polyangiaceae bacterium]|nr:hypothetical protein [Polyangiaceae bacterium]